jgi:hypothetical protein
MGNSGRVSKIRLCGCNPPRAAPTAPQMSFPRNLSLTYSGSGNSGSPNCRGTACCAQETRVSEMKCNPAPCKLGGRSPKTML